MDSQDIFAPNKPKQADTRAMGYSIKFIEQKQIISLFNTLQHTLHCQQQMILNHKPLIIRLINALF